MNFRRLRTGLGLVAFLTIATAGAGVAQLGTNPNAPPPPPLPNINPNAGSQSTNAPVPGPSLSPNAVQSAIVPAGPSPVPTALATAAPPTVTGSPTPAPSPSGRPRRGRKAAPSGTPSPEASDTPAPPEFKTLDGVWEIELQPIGHRLANYQHFSLVQTGSSLSGYWEHNPNRTKTPITGSFDGRLFQVNAAVTGGTVNFSGYIENMADMVGMQHLTAGDAGIAFTAQHRQKEKS